MAGLYIHIPFCKSRCIYCGFYSTTASEQRQRYVDAVCREMEIRDHSDAISTIYLGGGTPSQLSIQQLQQLFKAIYYIYKVEKDAEVTIECNPDDVTADFAEALAQLPVNRVSMGAQTFDNHRLQFLHRRHTAGQVPEAIQRLRDAGIRNISIDLMYGFPDETLDNWQHDIDAALSLNVEHISAYCLMIEEGTALFELMNKEQTKKHFQVCDEETERQMYERLIDQLTAAGYQHYEISNFSLPGFRSRHNSSYWTGVPYIGLGAAAHSYDGQRRLWNPDNLLRYTKGIEDGKTCYEGEELTADTRYNDHVMLTLRTCEGLDIDTLSDSERAYLLPLAAKYIDNGLLLRSGNYLRLSRQGLFVSDMIMSDLMIV